MIREYFRRVATTAINELRTTSFRRLSFAAVQSQCVSAVIPRTVRHPASTRAKEAYRMSRTEIMDLTRICETFPEEPSPNILRNNVLDTVDLVFGQGTRILVVQGPDGIGKTTLLRQFAIRHADNCFALFARPSSRITYDPGAIQSDLCNQLTWALEGRELPDCQYVDDQFFLVQLRRIARNARKTRNLYYFVLDGLDEIGDDELLECQEILLMLPFDHPNFRFLVGGSISVLPARTRSTTAYKSHELAGFTLGESISFFDGTSIDKDTVQEFHRVSRGHPGHLASALRLVESRLGIDAARLASDIPAESPEAYLSQLEWNHVDTQDELLIRALAVLAHDRQQHSLSSLARILGTTSGDLQARLGVLTFIDIDVDTSSVRFVSESYRSFAAEKLRSWSRTVDNFVLDDLLKQPDSDRSLTELPTYLARTENFEGLLTHLSPGNLSRMMTRSGSLASMKRSVSLGVGAALRLRRDSELFRFCIGQNILEGITQVHIPPSELEALMSVGEYAAAQTLAHSLVLVEDRLQMLALIAKAYKKQGLPVDPELSCEIRRLHDRTDYDALGARALEIAGDLFYSHPDLACGLLERASDANGAASGLDWMLAALSVLTIDPSTDECDARDTRKQLMDRIRNPRARRFSAEASLLFDDFTASDAIAEVGKFQAPADQLHLLQLWAKSNRRRSDALEVVDYALRLAIGTTEYAPNARVYRELSEALPFYTDEPRARQLVAILDGQKASIRRLGPTEEFVRLQLLLARTEARYDSSAGRNRIVDAYYCICENRDDVSRAACLSWLSSTLTEMDPNEALEHSEGLHSLTSSDLDRCISLLLADTADHYRVARPIVRALGRVDQEKAVRVARSLNTRDRRDRALLDVVDVCLRVPDSVLDLASVRRTLTLFERSESKEKALVMIMERAIRFKGSPTDGLLDSVVPMINQISTISNSGERCRACCLALQLLSGSGDDKYNSLSNHVAADLREAWDAVDVQWHKVDVGFRIAAALSSSAKCAAAEWLILAQSAKNSTSLNVESTAEVYVLCIQLVIRAFAGLLSRNLDDASDLARIARLMDVIGSPGERARLWADLALRHYSSGRMLDCRNIVAEKVKPLLAMVSAKDVSYRANLVQLLAPALYCAHKITALEELCHLPESQRDAAYSLICDYILTKCPTSDPFDAYPGQGTDATYEEIVDLCELLELVREDRIIYSLVSRIADTVSGSRRRGFTREQTEDIVRRLNEIVSANLPDGINIGHKGYQVASLAEIARMKKASTEDWNEIINQARAIPNIADKCLVLSIIASCLLPKEHERKSQLLLEAINLVPRIPCPLDQVDRYSSIAVTSPTSCANVFKDSLRRGMEVATRADEPEYLAAQRHLVDIAYRVSPEFASALASAIDDDPVRLKARANLRKRLEVLRIKSDMSTDTALPSRDFSGYGAAAWMLLGSLNANRLAPISMDRIREILGHVTSMPMIESYPVFAWTIENATRRFRDTRQAESVLRPLFLSMLEAAAFSGELANRSSTRSRLTSEHVARNTGTGSMVVREGEREAALVFLKEWLANCASGYIKIHDPFFGPNDLGLLQLIASAAPKCRVHILTSKKHQAQEHVASPFADTYSAHWHVNIADQDPPHTSIMVFGRRSTGDSPIHDRWWITHGGGLSIGTSFGSLGVGKTCEIRILSDEEARVREVELDGYLQMQIRESSGDRVAYEQFALV